MGPSSPYLAYRMELNDSTNRFRLIPAGNRIQQVLLFALLWSIPVATGAISIWSYMGAFYGVKFNKFGVSPKKGLFGFGFRGKFQKLAGDDDEERGRQSIALSTLRPGSSTVLPTIAVSEKRRTVVIATMEYDIEDWSIKIKIDRKSVV